MAIVALSSSSLPLPSSQLPYLAGSIKEVGCPLACASNCKKDMIITEIIHPLTGGGGSRPDTIAFTILQPTIVLLWGAEVG